MRSRSTKEKQPESPTDAFELHLDRGCNENFGFGKTSRRSDSMLSDTRSRHHHSFGFYLVFLTKMPELWTSLDNLSTARSQGWSTGSAVQV